MSDNKEWEERYKKQIVHHAVEISAQGIFVLRDFIAAELSRVREETLKEVGGIVEGLKKRSNGETQKCYRCGLPRKASEKLMLGCHNEKGLSYKSHLFRRVKNISKGQALTTI